MVFKTLTSFPKGQKCQLCLTAKVDPEALGNIYQTADVIVHYFCLLLASKIQQKGTDKQGLLGFFSRDIKKEIKRGSTIICNYCKKHGATVMCSRESCHLNFHVPCAQQKGSLHQYFNQFKSFCDKHKPRQKIPASLKNRKDLECVLCCSHIKFNAKSHEDDPIWPTCCKPQALLHKRCLQHFATSSGYYFKCPFCSNKEEFHKGMKTYGIYIPEQEASWETEPNAYRELLERDVSCDAVRCRCPRGPVYSVRNSKWYLEVCILCGASGRHRGCMMENIMTDTYECGVCSKVNSKFLNSVPSEVIPESSPMSDIRECNDTVQQSVDENISKNLSLECEEIVVISDSESENDEVQIIDVIPAPTVTKNIRKRQLPIRQEKRSGIKRQRLAEGGAETSSNMCHAVDEGSRSPLAQALDNSSFRTNKLANNPQACEKNIPNRESINNQILMINKVCTLSQFNQIEIERLHAESSNVNEEDNQSQLRCVDLVSEHEIDRVLVISDSDNESIASSLLDSDSSLLDLSEIPESEKSLLLENFSSPTNYAKEFRKIQTPKKRRKKKKRVVQKKNKSSLPIPQNLKPKSNTKHNKTSSGEQISIASEPHDLEPSISHVASTNIASSSHLENCDFSEDESFRGFACEEIQSKSESVAMSTPMRGKGSLRGSETCNNDEKTISSSQDISGNNIFLNTVDDTSKCFTLDNQNFIDNYKDTTCQTIDFNENAQLKCDDDNAVKTNSVVLKLLPEDANNCIKSVSNNFELSKSKINNYSNVSVNSIQDSCSKETSTDAAICNSDPSELSKNSSHGKLDLYKHKTNLATANDNNILIEEDISKKEEPKKTEAKKKEIKSAIKKSNKLGYDHKTKKALKHISKPKIICSLALEQPFGNISHSLFKLNKVQNHETKSSIKISDKKISLCSVNSTKVDGLTTCDIAVNEFSKVIYNTIGDSQSFKKCEVQSELNSPKFSGKVFLESESSDPCNEPHRKLGSSISNNDLPMGSQSPIRVSADLQDQGGRERNINEVPTKLNSLGKSLLGSPKDDSHTVLSEIVSDAPLNSKLSKNISEISPVSYSSSSHFKMDVPCESSIKFNFSETMNTANLKLEILTEHSEPHDISLTEKPSVGNASNDYTKLISPKSEFTTRVDSKRLSKSDVELLSKNCTFQFPKISDPFALSQPATSTELKKLSSECSNFVEDEALLKIKVLDVNAEKKLVCQSLINASFQGIKPVPSETNPEAGLESKLLTKISGPNPSSLVENSSVNDASKMQIKLNHNFCNSETQLETKCSSDSKKKSITSQRVSELPIKSDTSLSLLNHFIVDSSLSSNLLEDKHISKSSNMNEQINLDKSPLPQLQSCKSELKQSLEVFNSAESEQSIKKCKPSKIKDSRRKPNGLSNAQKNIYSFNKTLETDPNKKLTVIHAVKHLKQEEQAKSNSEGKVDLKLSNISVPEVIFPSPEPNRFQEQLVSGKHDFVDTFLVYEDSSLEISKIQSCQETKCLSDESRINGEFVEGLKNLELANKPKPLLLAKDKSKLLTESNSKDFENSELNDEGYCDSNENLKIATQVMDENNGFTSTNFSKQMSVEDSKVHFNIETKVPCEKSYLISDEKYGDFNEKLCPNNEPKNLKICLPVSEDNQLPIKNDSKLNIDESTSLCSVKNRVCNNLNIDKNEHNVNLISDDLDTKKHNRYELCPIDCSTCYNSVTLTAKHNFVTNDSIEVCFYCKEKISNTSIDAIIEQESSSCSCQNNRNTPGTGNCFSKKELHKDLCPDVNNGSELVKDQRKSLESDLNSNYESNESFEKQTFPFKAQLSIDSKEITSDPKSLNLLDNLSLEKKSAASESKQQPLQVIPSITGSEALLISEKKDPDISKINLVRNNKNNERSGTLHKNIISSYNNDKKQHFLKQYYNEVFKVKIFLKKVDGGYNRNSSLMSHVEMFSVCNRKHLREMLKIRYFSQNNENLVIYTDVCGFRYVRLFIENIPENIDPTVVFESGVDMSFYLRKLIRHSKTGQIISPQIILIVHGNSFIPDENVFHLLQSASNLNNIKLVVTTVPSQNHTITRFNRKLIDYSKRFGYSVWDITKIHFLTDTAER